MDTDIADTDIVDTDDVVPTAHCLRAAQSAGGLDGLDRRGLDVNEMLTRRNSRIG